MKLIQNDYFRRVHASIRQFEPTTHAHGRMRPPKALPPFRPFPLFPPPHRRPPHAARSFTRRTSAPAPRTRGTTSLAPCRASCSAGSSPPGPPPTSRPRRTGSRWRRPHSTASLWSCLLGITLCRTDPPLGGVWCLLGLGGWAGRVSRDGRSRDVGPWGGAAAHRKLFHPQCFFNKLLNRNPTKMQPMVANKEFKESMRLFEDIG